jgi:hypothetical protein
LSIKRILLLLSKILVTEALERGCDTNKSVMLKEEEEEEREENKNNKIMGKRRWLGQTLKRRSRKLHFIDFLVI